MNTVKRRGLRGTVIALGVALALAAVVMTLNTSVHANSGPDLVVGTPTVDDSSPYTGASFTLSATVTNNGDGESVATTLRYYRSTDATITTADTEVGTDAVGALAAAGTSEQSIDLTAPSAAGTYYYGACTDSVSGESDTTDNCSTAVIVTIKGRPDLSVWGVSVSPSIPIPGESFTLTGVVFNDGAGDSAATTLRFYQSTSRETSTTSDTEVGTAAVGAISSSGNNSSEHSIDLTAPTAGRYYYYVCVDTVPGESSTENCIGPTLVGFNTPATGAPTISGTAQVGQTLTASTTGISDADGSNGTYSYQWLADDTEIDGATNSTYTVQTTDNGKVIKVRVSFTNHAGNRESLTSAGTSAVVLGGL